MKLSDLTGEDFQVVLDHATDYLNEVRAWREGGHSAPEAKGRGPKIKGYKFLIDWCGATDQEAVAAFNEALAIVDGVTS